MSKLFAKINKQTKIVEDTIVADQVFVWDFPDFEDWIEFSLDGSIRKNPASIGYKYDKQLDAFIPPKPYDSWVLNESTYAWEPPTPKPTLSSYWNEETLSWFEME
jgi:hypothetical protein